MKSISELCKYTDDYLLINHKFNDEYGLTDERSLKNKSIHVPEVRGNFLLLNPTFEISN